MSERKKIKVLRKGKLRQVSRIQVGDTWLDKCWSCEQMCRMTRLSNGHNRHDPLIKKGILESSEQKIGVADVYGEFSGG